MKQIIFLFLLCCNTLVASELPYLYNKNCEVPNSAYEKKLVAHVQKSLEKAFKLESKISGSSIVGDVDINIWQWDTPNDHLLNNLCNLKDATHLHIGLLKGGSFIAALYGNQDLLKQQIGLDWFQEYPQELLIANCNKYLDASKYNLINGDCFNLDKKLFHSPIDIYFYDADHSLKGHEKAFTYYDDVFSDVFVAIVDDWRCPWVRRPTFKAFEKLNYTILFEAIIPDSDINGHGQYVAVIRKSTLN